MSGTQFVAITDAPVSPPGSSLQNSLLGALVMGQSCIVSGGIPSLSGSLTLTQPATTAIVNYNQATFGLPTPASTPLTFTASRDTYVDLLNAGTYTLVAVTNGAGAPALTANSVRLYKAVSNGSQVTSVTQLAPNAVLPGTAISSVSETPSGTALGATSTIADNIARLWNSVGGVPTFPIAQTNVGPDLTEAATLDTLSGGSTLVNNLNRLRAVLKTLGGGGSFVASQAAILADGTNSASPTLSGSVKHPSAIPATLNNGQLSVGPGPFDGVSSGKFVGLNSSGTLLAGNAGNAFGGALLDLQVFGVSKHRVDSAGNTTIAGTLGAGNTTITGTFSASGPATLSSTLGVGNTTITGSLSVSGTSTLTGGANLGSNIAMGNNAITGIGGLTANTSVLTINSKLTLSPGSSPSFGSNVNISGASINGNDSKGNVTGTITNTAAFGGSGTYVINFGSAYSATPVVVVAPLSIALVAITMLTMTASGFSVLFAASGGGPLATGAIIDFSYIVVA